MGKYLDKREDFFRDNFNRALPYERYVKETTPEKNYEEKWRQSQKAVAELSLPSVLSSFKRQMHVLVLSGIWCGDCSRQGPILNQIQLAAPVIEIRFAENSEFEELKEELRINGAEKVPVIVVLSEDFYEVARFGDRHLSVYRNKMEKAGLKEATANEENAAKELGASCDPGIVPPIQNALQLELQEWVDFFERAQHLLRLAPALRQRYSD